MRVLGRQHGDGGLDDSRVAHAGVEIAGRKGGRRRSPDAGAGVGGVHELARGALVLRRHRAGEVEGAAGNVRVDVNAAGEDDHTGGVDGAPAVNVGNDAAIVHADVLDDAVDIVGG